MSSSDLPPEESHVEKARRAIRVLHTAHNAAASPMDRVVDQTTSALGRPIALLCIILTAAAWAGANVWAGRQAFDPFPFPDLEFAISATALAIAILILASQRRADKLADARERMTLELALQNAQKVSKVIELLEELRRDSPSVPDRTDLEAEDMSTRRSETEILENIPSPPTGILGTDVPATVRSVEQ
jgi:uncharacterized membrane protein